MRWHHDPRHRFMLSLDTLSYLCKASMDWWPVVFYYYIFRYIALKQSSRTSCTKRMVCFWRDFSLLTHCFYHITQFVLGSRNSFVPWTRLVSLAGRSLELHKRLLFTLHKTPFVQRELKTQLKPRITHGDVGRHLNHRFSPGLRHSPQNGQQLQLPSSTTR